jgi:hypothetical protein
MQPIIDKSTKPARVLDKLLFATRALVADGRLPACASDKEALGLVAAHLKALGLSVPSERSWRRHIARLRPLWRMRQTKRAA